MDGGAISAAKSFRLKLFSRPVMPLSSTCSGSNSEDDLKKRQSVIVEINEAIDILTTDEDDLNV